MGGRDLLRLLRRIKAMVVEVGGEGMRLESWVCRVEMEGRDRCGGLHSEK